MDVELPEDCSAEELEQIHEGNKKETIETQTSGSAFSKDQTLPKPEKSIPEESAEHGNRRLRRYEAKMARRKNKENN